MKNIALVLPLTIALLLSACNNANNQTDNSPNDQASENIDTLSSDEVILPTPEKTEEAPQIKDEIVNNDSHKKDIIKFLYRDAVLSLKNDDTAEELDTLFAYADRDLQNAIALVKADSMNTYDGYADEISDCSEVRYILNLSVGNGYSIDEAADVKYKVLDNGNVRASILLEGDEDIADSDFNNYKDFSLKCSDEGCKITDMLDSYGDSALQAVELACR
ncbi:hypothetical protein M0N77_08900 [Psychrobacter sp. AH5]|uniref:hypothetical protein n=1 Tax=Psychrobacter sp. AH5 TaxID=2937433 RepID=UPI0033418F9D